MATYTTAADVAAALQTATETEGGTSTYYLSKYTGVEIEALLDTCNTILPYIQANVAIPAGVLTGDFTSTDITTITTTSWLSGITVIVERAFSTSASDNTYQVVLSDGTVLLELDSTLIQTADMTVMYYINNWIPAGSTVSITASDTNAYGQVSIKLHV